MNFLEHYFSTNMTIEQIKEILQNKINDLYARRNLAYMSGDLKEYASLENEIAETQISLDKVNS